MSTLTSGHGGTPAGIGKRSVLRVLLGELPPTQAAKLAAQITGRARRELSRIEDHDISKKSFAQPPALFDAEDVGREPRASMDEILHTE